MALFSWVYWLTWMAAGLAYEIPAVLLEKRKGTLPLTRVVRDRLMRGRGLHIVIRFGVLTFLTWLWIHFVLPGHGW